MQFEKLSTPGSINDPFTGITWQQFFQQLFRIIPNLPAYGEPQYTVAGLPTDAIESQKAYATNGRKVGEGAGAGTGVPVYFSAALWRVYADDTQVLA